MSVCVCACVCSDLHGGVVQRDEGREQVQIPSGEDQSKQNLTLPRNTCHQTAESAVTPQESHRFKHSSFLFPRTILSILQTPGCCYLLLFDESVWTRSTCMSVLTRFHGDEGTEAPSELTRALPVANLWQNFYNTNSTTELNLWPLNFRKLILNCNLWGKSHYKMTDD